MGKGSDAPAPIDPAEAIRAQAEANRVDLNSPFGGQRYAQGPDGRWSLNTYLSPEMMGLANQQISLASQEPQQFGIPGYDQLMGNVMQRVGGHFQGGGMGGAKPMGAQMMPPPQFGQMLGGMPEGSGVQGLAQLLQQRGPSRDPRGG